MSLPLRAAGDGHSRQKQPPLVGIEFEVSTSSWGSHNITDASNPIHLSLIPPKKSKVEESDEDLFTVPDVESQPSSTVGNSAISSGAAANNCNNIIIPDAQNQFGFPGKRRRGRNPVDKEYRRLKRLLRNRVSAQQARERKKVYVNELESRAKELQDRNAKLEEKISTLINENTMLRKVLMNTRPKADQSVEPKQNKS